MSNPVILGAKLNLKRSSLVKIEEQIAEIIKREEGVLEAIEAAETEEDLEAVEKSADDIKAELDAKNGEKEGLESEIEELENELTEINEKAPGKKEGDERRMPKDLETREAIKGYVQSKGQTRDFTSVEGGPLIPEELLAPKKALEDVIDLSKYVREVKVNSASGKYPVIKKSGGRMVTVEELEKNPKLANPTITEVKYDISTYRGYIPMSQESIDDADYDVVGLISDEIQDQELNTKNVAIATVFKSAPAKAIEGLDGLITLLNTGFKQVYNVKAFVSSSLYNELDLLKDKEGRYLLQDDITVASGKRIKGREVVVLDDDIIGTAVGNLVAFIGDAKEFAAFFDRKQASVKWVDNNIYGQLLAGFVRFDTKAVDTDAGYYITYTPEVPEV
jgi:HK97 family phage major capsid protein